MLGIYLKCTKYIKYVMCKYIMNIKKFFWKIVERFAHLLAGKVQKDGMPLGMLVRQIEKLARL